MATRIKPTPSSISSNSGFYQKTEWHTGDIITQPRMMNIEDWLASATDELLSARFGKTVRNAPTSWNSISERFEYITDILTLVNTEGVEEVLQQVREAVTDSNAATDRANDAATLIENMTITARTLSAGQAASVVSWEQVNNAYALVLGIPVPSFTTSTVTTIDGTTQASVTVNNTNSLTRNLAFSIPVPKFGISTSTITSGSITATATATDTNTLNPKIAFGIPVVKPQIGTITTTSTGSIPNNIVSLSNTNTLTPNMNFNIPVQLIKQVNYTQATPGTAGSFSITDADKLDPTLSLTVPVQNISQVTATALAAGASPTASLEYLDQNRLNLRLNLGLPIAKPIDVVKTYSSVAALQSGIRNDVAVGYYAIVASSEADEDNGKLYIRTSTSPYYSFIADISAATPHFQIGNVNIVDASQTKNASIDITNPSEPVLNLTIPAKPVINSVNPTITNAGTTASGSISGTVDNLSINLTIPAIPQFQRTVNVTNNEDATARATADITGTADNLVLHLNLPPDLNMTMATASRLGGIKVGDTLTIDNAGVLNVGLTEHVYSFNFAVTDWTLSNDFYTITKAVTGVNENKRITVDLGNSYFNLTSNLIIESTNTGNVVFKTAVQPLGTIEGILYVKDTIISGVIE